MFRGREEKLFDSPLPSHYNPRIRKNVVILIADFHRK